MNLVTPRGFRDRLPAEASERESLSASIGAVFESWGYGLVESPVVEVYAMLEAAAGDLEGTAFRLFDADGRLLALRPDMTLPLARVAASRLRSTPGPHRLRYDAEVFREHESLRGQARQFTQLGVELVGAGGPAADAEIVALMVESLVAAGLPEFTVALGTVAVLHALVDAAGAEPSWKAAVLKAAHDRNLVALDALMAEPQVPAEVGQALSEVMRIKGGREAIERCRAVAASCGCASVLDELEITWDLLDASETSGRVVVDFGVLRDFDYYTGIILEAYAPSLGLPLGGGGRYDGLMTAFGAATPATGFAIGLERLQVALVEQSASAPVRGLDALVGGDPAERFGCAKRLRDAGWHVRMTSADGLELVREAERAGAAEALVARAGALVRLDRDGGPALPLEEPTPAPPTLSWAKGGPR
ncbi:MAG: ATP phosphoribosyltransferase regulatory subunit [Coriobacteriales bacterium]|nr:ATP phosphoribosyltransferase regulatory subunit [Coriobacteriales bacterium]